jgi:hypothetical protein
VLVFSTTLGGAHTSTHWPPHTVFPPGHSHSHVVGLTVLPVEVHPTSVGHSHWQLALRNCGGSQVETHAPLHSTLPPGHSHSQLLGLMVPPLEVQVSLAGHWHWQLVLSTLGGEQTSTHWPPQRVLPPGHWHSQVLGLTVPPLPVHAWLGGHWQLQVLVFRTLGAVQVRHW